MDISKYSQSSVEIIKEANKVAIRKNNVEVSDLHIFYAILTLEEKLIRTYFKELKVIYQDVLDDTENALTGQGIFCIIQNILVDYLQFLEIGPY